MAPARETPSADAAPPSGRLAAKQAERRRRVIRTAMELAAEGGYDGVQMRDVAAQADVALGTLYRYFSSKDQLLSEALTEWVGELENNLGRRPPKTGTPADRVAEILRRASRAVERNEKLASAMIKAMTSPEGGTDRAPSSAGKAFHALIEQELEDYDEATRDQMIHALDLIWFALVVRWMAGSVDARTMGDDLEAAARLIVR